MALTDPAQLGAGVSSLAFPSIARLIVGFLFTVGLAFGAAFVLRRLWPLFRKRSVSSSNVQLLGRTVVSRTLTVHLIEVDGARLAVAEGRNSVAITAMASGSTASQRSSP
jgi:flagellar biogenesis protein FliO